MKTHGSKASKCLFLALEKKRKKLVRADVKINLWIRRGDNAKEFNTCSKLSDEVELGLAGKLFSLQSERTRLQVNQNPFKCILDPVNLGPVCSSTRSN